MSKHINNKHIGNKVNKRKWFILGAVGTALLLIPRRSSQQVVSISESVYTADKEKNVNDNII